MPAARIAQLYPSRAEYQQKFEAATDATIKAGYALPEDRATLLAFAEPDRVVGLTAHTVIVRPKGATR